MNHLLEWKNIYRYLESQFTPINSGFAEGLLSPSISSPFEGRIAINIDSCPKSTPTLWENSIRNSLSSSVILLASSMDVSLLKILWQITKTDSSIYNFPSSPIYVPAQGIIVVPPNLSLNSSKYLANFSESSLWKELSYLGMIMWYWRSILSTGFSGKSFKCSIKNMIQKKEKLSRRKEER